MVPVGESAQAIWLITRAHWERIKAFPLSIETLGGWMVDVMYQLDWALRCPDIQSSVILSMSVKVILDEMNI